MKAVIFAGGLGTRLAEETSTRPKPMVEIGGRPILWHIMKMYSHHGINEFIICAGYKANVIKDYLLWLQGILNKGIFPKLFPSHVRCDFRYSSQPNGNSQSKSRTLENYFVGYGGGFHDRWSTAESPPLLER